MEIISDQMVKLLSSSNCNDNKLAMMHIVDKVRSKNLSYPELEELYWKLRLPEINKVIDCKSDSIFNEYKELYLKIKKECLLHRNQGDF